MGESLDVWDAENITAFEAIGKTSHRCTCRSGRGCAAIFLSTQLKVPNDAASSSDINRA
jgi:hypothetical protein